VVGEGKEREKMKKFSPDFFILFYFRVWVHAPPSVLSNRGFGLFRRGCALPGRRVGIS